MGADEQLDNRRRPVTGKLAELLLQKGPQQRMNLEDPMLRRHEEAEPVPLDEGALGVAPSTASATAGATDDESDSWLSDQRSSGSAAW